MGEDSCVLLSGVSHIYVKEDGQCVQDIKGEMEATHQRIVSGRRPEPPTTTITQYTTMRHPSERRNYARREEAERAMGETEATYQWMISVRTPRHQTTLP